MITCTCDRCHQEIDHRKRGIAKLPTIRFDLGGGAYGANHWCSTAKRECDGWATDGPEFTCQFNTTDLHFCEDCVFETFSNAVSEMRHKRLMDRIAPPPVAPPEEA